MKTTFFLLAFFSISSMLAQNFQPISSTSHKRFVNVQDPNDSDYFSFVMDTVVSVDTIQFAQYLRESGDYIDVFGTSCSGWGGGFQPKADTIWLGRKQEYNMSTQEFKLWNYNDEPLTFQFGLTLGDSTIFYSNGSDDYYLRYDALNMELVIDSMDNVKTFTIWKYDAMNNLVPGSLNGFEIRLSENYGLASFIDCNEFPVAEKGLTLMGQVRPYLGYYQMTKEEVYPWQTGDTLQYEGYNNEFTFGGPSTTSYKTMIITDRIETVDSVWIYFDLETQLVEYPPGLPFPYPTQYNINYPNPIVYHKSEPITEFPHMSVLFSSEDIGGTNWMDSVDNCGMRGQYNYAGDWQLYCDSCDCWTEYDGNGTTMPAGNITEGLGMTYKKTMLYGAITNPKWVKLVYYNVSGVQCGDYIPLSVTELEQNVSIELVKIVDVLGRTVENPEIGQLYIYWYSNGASVKKVFIGE